MKTLVAAALLALTAATAPAFAYDMTSKALVNVTADRIALKSHDPVAYFTVGKPVLGSAAISAEYEGAIYRFSSEANRAAFLAEPSKYAPMYGGYCQYGAVFGKKFDGDPTIFNIANGRLSLFSYPAAFEGFKKDPAGNAKKADDNWVTIKDKSPNELFGF